MDNQQARIAQIQKLTNIQYDPTNDVMYLSIGEPQEAIGEEIEDGVVLRFNPNTGEPVGVTISDFTARFKQEPRSAVSVPLAELAHA